MIPRLEVLGLKWVVVDKFGGLLLWHHCEVLTDNNNPLAHLRTARLGATEMGGKDRSVQSNHQVLEW